jgi:probable DNA repair protein
VFQSLLQSWITARNDLPAEQLPSGWAMEFHKLLRHFGWPGDRRLNASEFPVHDAWRDLLGTLATLDPVLGTIGAARARRLLRELARETTFDPPADAATVHLIPASEPLCVPYDHVWLAGAHDGVFPPPASANPFLPLAVQREYGIPNISARDVLAKARRWTQQLTSATSNLVVSTATLERKEPRRLSALFAGLPVVRMETRAGAWNALDCEELSDTVGPPPAPGAQQGGVRLFEHQAKCPFHAFAELRLGAKELEEPYLGFDKRKQGTALHAALHEFWRQVGDWARLEALGAEGRLAAVTSAVDKVLTEEWRAETKLRERMREVERERLTEVLRRWVEVERQRPPFKVLSQEEKAQVELAGLAVNVRADRVDELRDGRVVVLDYKTSAKSAGSWKEPRIGEPQLPLYAVTTNRHVAAVAFAQVQAEKQFFRGVAEDKQVLKLTKFDALNRDVLAQWREALEGVAREYLAGVARVDWKRGGCDFCKLSTLCRKHELRQVAAGDDDGV